MRYGAAVGVSAKVGSHEGGGRVTEIASKPSNPCARSEDLIVEELGEELLVYDMKADRGHCLSPMAARVWRRCDGRTPAKDIGAELDLDPDAVARALEELAACKLLEPTPKLTVVATNGDGTTRRELATRFVKAGAVAAAAPLIVSVAAPTPAQAQTLAFCAQFTPQGCGPCAVNGCCCCVEQGGDGFLCVPPDNIGWSPAVRRSTARPSRSAAVPCPTSAAPAPRPRAPSSKRRHRMPSPSLPRRSPLPLSRHPPSGPDPAYTRGAGPRDSGCSHHRGPRNGGSTTPPPSEGASTP